MTSLEILQATEATFNQPLIEQIYKPKQNHRKVKIRRTRKTDPYANNGIHTVENQVYMLLVAMTSHN
jgi:hypothetical protein